MSEHYKSLISDDDVIKELIKDSERRQGKLIIPRLKPNLNFFQRTVNSLVSTNNRIDKGVDTFRSDYLKDEKTRKYRVPVYKSSSNKMPLVDYAFERRLVLETKDKCIRPKGNKRSQKESTKRKWEPHKLSFGSEVEDAASTDQSQVQSYKKTLQILDGISTDTDLDDLEIVNMKEPSSMRKSVMKTRAALIRIIKIKRSGREKSQKSTKINLIHLQMMIVKSGIYAVLPGIIKM
ncbi:uncharacterized protein LOC125504370 isoform X2 [Dendroctonus ponderosae]|uniref:Uncharacterized protein n=1 Tax=Dendroctonus ponderosae TaxID=77166 RepID=A0AAR5Q0J2_DENPD|nr:uncharacterized protein LOC109542133 isoform X2 [Dendroctonus ponderosae]XP_048522003.1 uncharacterized protein LOC125504285 isoform X2 [Dendroctonus ponderosae]XP_048522192.1 uncharacterized protein LOC125504370 isoform X2 [Dendroctonus ponderosae]